MSIPYLITFTPRGNFFFGGSVSFSDSDEFYAESEKFPQPTTIMGALRAALLIGNDLLLQHKHGRFVPAEKKTEAAELVGKTHLNNFEEDSGFGIIEKISPVFLIKDDDAFFTVPGDVAKDKNGKFKITEFKKEKKTVFSCNCGIEANFIPKPDFNHKDDTRFAFLGGKAFWEEYSKGSEISGSGIIDLNDKDQSPYIAHSQVGIGLEKRRIKEGKFYVKNDFSLKKGFAFAVICLLNQDNESFAETIVLGGDQSVFTLEKKEINIKDHPIISNLLNPQTDIQGSKKIAAVSPLVLKEDSDLFENIEHAVVKGISNVRMLNSIRFDKGKLSSPFVNEEGKKILKSDAYRIIPAGSVFYLKDNASIGHTEGLPEKLGYNQIIAWK